MKQKFVRVYAPATIGNTGPGFDMLGIALEYPGDVVWARRSSSRGVHLVSVTGLCGGLPRDTAKNAVCIAARSLLKKSGARFGVGLSLHKGIRAGSGIGSSASSAVASAVAVNNLLGKPLTSLEVLEAALESERQISGGLHADNVAPALFGGCVLIRNYHPLQVVQIPVPRELWCVVVRPDLEVRTAVARKLLPKKIDLEVVVRQTGALGGLISGMFQNDLRRVAESVTDYIAEPAREGLIPGFGAVKRAAKRAGSLGCTIAGSGPALFSFADNRSSAIRIGRAMSRAFSRKRVNSQVIVSQLARTGARVI